MAGAGEDGRRMNEQVSGSEREKETGGKDGAAGGCERWLRGGGWMVEGRAIRREDEKV